MLKSLPVVELSAHPAYAGLAPTACEQDETFHTLLAQIDRDYESLLSDHSGGNDARLARFDAQVARRLARLRTLLAERPTIRPAFLPRALNAFDRAAKALRNDLATRDYGAVRNSMTARLSAGDAERLSGLHRDGFFRFAPDAKLAMHVLSSTRLIRAAMSRRARDRAWSHCVSILSPFSTAGEAIQAAVKDSGLIKLASDYMGRPMQFAYAALDHAHSGQDWHSGCYDDDGLATSKTVYMHTDAGSDTLKAMFYLKDVGPQDAPFSFIPGSHRWQRSLVGVAFQCAMDKEQCFMYEMTGDKIDFASRYYRPHYKQKQGRADILSLPGAFQGSTHFGDDVMDGSELSQALLAQEHKFLDPAGTIILFDGSRGIHRGSVAEGGTRWAVQLAFQIASGEPERPPPWWKKLLRPVNRRRLELQHNAHLLLGLAGLAKLS